MKRIVALILVLLMLSAACAEGIVIRELPQYRYINLSLINPEAYPEVRLMDQYVFHLFESYREPVFLCFPGPEGIEHVSFFDERSVRYTDAENLIQYSYYGHDSASFEEFLNRTDDESCILLDGSDGAAAYINPDYCHAYGLLPLKEFSKNAKLEIDISLAYLDRKMPEDTRREALSTAILNEVDRVKREMHYKTFDGFWTEGMYTGAKLLSEDYQYLLCYDFPYLTKQVDNAVLSATMTVTKVDGPKIEGVFNFGNGNYIEMELELTTYGTAVKKLEEGEKNVTKVTLSNGNEWILDLCNVDEKDNSIYAWRALKLTGLKDDRDDPVYVELYLTRSSREMGNWMDVNACVSDLLIFDESLSIVDPADDPYVPVQAAAATEPSPAVQAEPEPAAQSGAEAGSGTAAGKLQSIFSKHDSAPAEEPAPETAPAAAPASEGTWFCPECGSENSGKFCPECGTPKPESAEWTCPNCGAQNDGKFCPECGTPKP